MRFFGSNSLTQHDSLLTCHADRYYLEKVVTEARIFVFSYYDVSHILLWEGFAVCLVASLLSHRSQDSSL